MIELSRYKNENFTLVLSGGAALGLSHIGVLKKLDQYKINPNEIIGTSMGAIIGTLYSFGLDSSKLINFLEESNLFELTRLSFKNSSLIDSKKIKNKFKEITGEITFNEFDKNLKLIATSLNTGESIEFSKENTPEVKIIDALIASMSLPIFFEPVEINSNLYVDGYLSSNFPFEFSKNDLILGVDVIAKTNLKNFTYSKGFFSKAKTLFKIYDRAFFLQIRNQTKFKLGVFKKEISIINPDLSGFLTFDFLKSKEIIKIGEIEFEKYFNL